MEIADEISKLKEEFTGFKLEAAKTLQLSERLQTFLDRTAAIEKELNDLKNSAKAAAKSAQANSSNISELKAQAEHAVKQIEEDTRKANSESGFAFNAKGNAEEHARVIAQIRGTVESTFSNLNSTKVQIEEATSAIFSLRSSAESNTALINEYKASSATLSAQVMATHDRVLAALPSIDQGTKDANTITAMKASVEATTNLIQQLLSQIRELAAKAKADTAEITENQEDSRNSLQSMADAVNTAQQANERLTSYEHDIKHLKTTFAEMNAKLEGLLPHATSAGLASAFHKQKTRFSKPQPYWLALFVVTIIFLIASAGVGLPTSDATWDAILRHFVNRLPLVAPLVWLAIYSGHHYSTALRMEEDYAFKEAVSTAFEGYKREMMDIPSTNDDVRPLITLCENVLKALAERPGRIYDGKVDVVTPLTPATSMLKEIYSEIMRRKNENL